MTALPGCLVWDSTGKEYLDCAAGIAVNILGHGDDKWAAAIAEQASSLAHVSNLYHTVAPVVRAAVIGCLGSVVSVVMMEVVPFRLWPSGW